MQRGAAPTVRGMLFLLHGAPGDGSLWEPVVSRLPAGIRVATPTFRCFGPGAEASPDAFGTSVHSHQLIEWLESADERPAAVAAWSYSTHVVLDVLLRRPELVSRAFLYEPGLHTYLDDPEDLRAYGGDAQAAFAPVAEALQRDGPLRAVEALFESSGGPGCFAALPPGRRERYLAGAQVMPLLMGGGRPPASITADDLGRIVVPVTVAMGARTRPLFAIASRAVARAIPEARLTVVEDADHMFPEVDPGRFAALLEAWLTS